MPELRATVKINVTSAEKALKKLEQRIASINRTASGSQTSFSRIASAARQATTQVNSLERATRNVETSQRRVTNEYKRSNSQAGNLLNTIKGLVATYIGLQGVQGMFSASDTLTNAQNKLNYVNSQMNGDPISGGYSSATLTATKEQLDKIYASAQRTRSSYSDMITNVAKTMMLAGDAFGKNVDNAIRFQEVMAEAYAVSGASQQEISSSMYQMVQALGSGILQGDELRSVREGAPMAYKAIEKFAQGVYKSTDSLKKMASEGLITSDIVVAAILDAGKQVDSVFQNTATTFSQTATMIKNMAMKAFQPALESLNKLLNSETFATFMNNVAIILAWLGEAMVWVMNAFNVVFTWIVENWSWLQSVAIAVLIAIVGYLAWMAGKWALAHAPMLAMIAILALIIAYISHVANAAAGGAEFIIEVAVTLGMALIAIGVFVALALGSTAAGVTLAIIGGILLLLGAFTQFAGEIIGGAYVIAGAATNVFNWIVTACKAMGAAISAIANNIRIAFGEAFYEVMKIVNSVVSAVIGIPGMSINTSMITNTLTGLEAEVGGQDTYQDVGAAWSSAWSEYKPLDLNEEYAKGFAEGEKIKQDIEDFGSKVQDIFKIDETSGDALKDQLGSLGSFSAEDGSLGVEVPDLGLDTTPIKLGDVPGVSDLGNVSSVGSTGSSPATKELGSIADDTSKISDSMELVEEDLEYLRKLANLEWKKEFTTASIKVDMSNFNTINGNDDLDGIATRLADKLYEELGAVANGVYV